jgi:hemolysin D
MTVIALPGVATSAAPQTPPAAPPVQTAPAGPPSDTPTRWSDPLRLIQNEAPTHIGRIVLWVVSLLTLTLFVWAAIGKLDIVATTEGKLVSQTLLKVVQPAEQGVVKQILVQEGDTVQAGQVLVRLDTTVAKADTSGLTQDMAAQRMQERRITSELTNQPFTPQPGDDLTLFNQVQGQLTARRGAQNDAFEQERQLLAKAQGEHLSARQILTKLQQSLPGYLKVAADYKEAAQEGVVPAIASLEKTREAQEKTKDLDAQQATLGALNATIEAQKKRVSQLQSTTHSDLQKELAEIRAKIEQLRPSLLKTTYREGLMELKAPQAGTVKDIATTTEGAVVQPGSVVLTLLPLGEPLFADVAIKNEDIGFIQVGQSAQVKLAAYPFQKYGLLTGKVVHVSADATEVNAQGGGNGNAGGGSPSSAANPASQVATYKARIALDQQHLISPAGQKLQAGAGMQVAAEIHQGKRTVLEYLLSPVSKAVQEAGREK